MDDQIDYRALYEAEVLRRKEEERRRKDAERRQKEAEKQLENTSLLNFLRICHKNIFLKLDVQKNSLLVTSGGVTRVDGKLYPRILKPWREFDARLEASFATLEQAFQDQPSLLPPAAGLDYLASKLSDKKLAGEEDLKNFECLAVEGCALDVLPQFLELARSGVVAMQDVDIPDSISFNNYPYGVVAADSDELVSEAEQDQHESHSSQQSSRRGRSRTRRSRSSRKPLRTKSSRPAYIGALGVAKRDMDAEAERVALEVEERDRSGPRPKRLSPERTKVVPDQWCFRHGGDGAVRPLFVIEYKAAHKIDSDILRECLKPEVAASLMEDTIRALPQNLVKGAIVADNTDDTASNYDNVAKRDIVKMLTQTYHYMVEYGLQYSYATTGNALIFLYMDPEQPSALQYHLEEPRQSVRTDGRDDLKHTAVGLVVSFVLMAMSGRYMTHRWKKAMQKTQPKWPTPYDDMGVTPPEKPLRINTIVTLAPSGHNQAQTTKTHTPAEGYGDPSRKHTNNKPNQGDEDDDGGSNIGIISKPGGSGSTQAQAQESSAGASMTRTTPSAGSTASDPIQNTLPWSLPVNAPLTPSLPYCTQACLLGLKTGGAKDPNCLNVALHKMAATTAGDANGERHPISVEEFRTLLVQQLANDMDHDCCSLERFGMYGAIGALFKLALSAYGYCFVGKGVQRVHYHRLAKEAAVYESHLAAGQGRLVPVNLGIIELEEEYWTECGAHISYMMLMSFAGKSLREYTPDASKVHQSEMQRTLRDLRSYGVDHGDVNNNNMVWNDELQRVMAIDFDHASVGSAAPLQPTAVPSETASTTASAAASATASPALPPTLLSTQSPLSPASPPPDPASGPLKRRQTTSLHGTSPQRKRARTDLSDTQGDDELFLN